MMTPPRNLPYADEEIGGRFVAVALAILRKMADCKEIKFPLSGEFLRLFGHPKYELAAALADRRVLHRLSLRTGVPDVSCAHAC